MTKKIRADRVASALNNMANWRGKAKSQGATHLFPMLALIERGAGNLPGTATLMNETPHEFDFWNKYFRLVDENEAKPYFNPVTLRRAEAGFPHSNSATIRKNTFAGKWNAASRRITDNGEEWILADDYADIFRDKVLTKGPNVARAPILDIAALFFRDREFPDDADARDLEAAFRSEFPQRDEDYEKLFVFHPEDPDKIFVEASEDQDYYAAIQQVLVNDVKSSSAIPVVAPDSLAMDLDDPILLQVQKLLGLGTSGIILTGVPGTGKSYYAKRIGKHLVVDSERDMFRVQFHPSYGYEDFVEGYRPDEIAQSGFKVVDKIFLIACLRAKELAPAKRLVVMIVDEINRGDPARIFGELLTYIERNYRGEKFTLPFSGKQFSVPENLVIIGTMNPYDRSVAQVDAAFVRRFDHIEITPSREVVESLLEEGGGFTQDQVFEIGQWFDVIQRIVPFGIGHSFFSDIKNVDHLKLVWEYRLRPAAVHAIELNDGAMDDLAASFHALVRRLEGVADHA
ncbi:MULTISPECIES: AAA family ATPase [Thalassospira]|uniref:McrB family protein n=1 Tax=Thalassospira TaxID=168934 RepID=UPI0007A582B7|nr:MULTISPECIES: AAA family ATPase [Thalassospira]KZC98728.1 hypothetical protein AUQ41_15420 [Thalassospira sp. MCCC 1A02898]MEE3046461.1 AAA family ATPase [Pseudomonadota bacterium]ONH86414.1 restriction endonuclease [Thalassospira sp. MCCC 1A02803]|tara:strand:+ start:242 stop:1783 length:1542 start_codon:yes stop_codon:yes gene_type:complete